MRSELQVDFLGPDETGLPGRLGLTSAPGGWWPGRPWAGAGPDLLDDDIRLLAQEHGATLLVTLLGRRELAGLGDLKRAARDHRIQWLHHPIPDMEPPGSVASAARLVGRLTAHLEGGRTAVVHCLAGLGRTGTVAACLLVGRGRGAQDAIAVARAVRPGSVQTPEQAEFVETFERFHRAARPPRWNPFRRG